MASKVSAMRAVIGEGGKIVNKIWYEEKPYNFGPKANSFETGEALYRASCHCSAVRYEVNAEPLDAKLCHCKDCQKLHGAPFEWVCIFQKNNVRFTSGVNQLYFWSSELGRGFENAEASERQLPVKVSCTKCRTPIADEGRNMWLAYVPLFDFTGEIPESFNHTCHLFYAARVIDIPDEKPKWMGHKNKSPLWMVPE